MPTMKINSCACKIGRNQTSWWSPITLRFSQCIPLLLFQKLLRYTCISCLAKRRHRRALFSNCWLLRWLCHLRFTQETVQQSPTCNQVPHAYRYSVSLLCRPGISSDWLLAVPTHSSTWMLLKDTCIIQWDSAQTSPTKLSKRHAENAQVRQEHSYGCSYTESTKLCSLLFK